MKIPTPKLIQTALLFALAMTVSACGQKSATADGPLAWLPTTSKYDAELATVPKDAVLQFSIPRDDPINAHSAPGAWGGISSNGDFVPKDKKSYIVEGGSLISKLGPIEKRAKWGDWDFVNNRPPLSNDHPGWGNSLTNGDIILAKKMLLDAPKDKEAANSFEIESYGNDYVLIHLDSKKGHRLCFLQEGTGMTATVGYIGTKATVNGKVFERKVDGWYPVQ